MTKTDIVPTFLIYVVVVLIHDHFALLYMHTHNHMFSCLQFKPRPELEALDANLSH